LLDEVGGKNPNLITYDGMKFVEYCRRNNLTKSNSL